MWWRTYTDITAQTKYLVSGAADSCMKLWDIRTGKCLFTWEFLTAVKRVAWRSVCRYFYLGYIEWKADTSSEDDNQLMCITEQRSGQPSIIRIYNINREDITKRKSPSWFSLLLPIPLLPFSSVSVSLLMYFNEKEEKLIIQNQKNRWQPWPSQAQKQP